MQIFLEIYKVNKSSGAVYLYGVQCVGILVNDTLTNGQSLVSTLNFTKLICLSDMLKVTIAIHELMKFIKC